MGNMFSASFPTEGPHFRKSLSQKDLMKLKLQIDVFSFPIITSGNPIDTVIRFYILGVKFPLDTPI